MKNHSYFVLYFWIAFQFVLALGIVLSVVVFGKNAPAITILFSNADIALLDPRAVQTINSMGILLNGFVVVSMYLIAKNLYTKSKSFDSSVLYPLVAIQILGFLSDMPFGNKNLGLNIISTVVLGIGLCMARTLKGRKV